MTALRKKAEGLLARAKRGDDFASLAAASSDGPEALQGGVMGVRPLDGWPDLFVKAVGNLQKGQVSALIQSGNGFHIIKVLDRGTAQPAPARTARAPAPARAAAEVPAAARAQPASTQVTQTRARHILIKTSTVMSDQLARQRLEQVRQRLVAGDAKFEDMARQYSQDSTAPQGGELGWLNPGETVPPFESAMNALQPGEISQPVQSPFGWHLIQVEERRQHDATDEMARMKARQILFERRAQPAFEDWLDQLRAQAYVDNRLKSNSASNRTTARPLMSQHQARKRFGQNFLTDDSVVESIVRAVAPARGDAVVEIGPGLSALTRPLLERLDRLTVVEIDRDLAARLRKQFEADRLTVVEADALTVDFAQFGPGLRVVGNLPYNISSPLLFHLMASADPSATSISCCNGK